MIHGSTRRDFLRSTCGMTLAVATGGRVLSASLKDDPPAQTALPRWRGFNLLDFFQAFSRSERSSGMVREDDLRWIRDWGFDFVRLPMDYWLWIDSDWRKTRKLNPDDIYRIRESTLEKVDRTLELCQKYGLHLSLNFHRAPGYCINQPEREPFVLWSDRKAEDAFVHHWDLFARRYRAIDTKVLSFNLINEAPRARDGYMSRDDYRRVMSRATAKIRESSPERTVIIDGLSVGTEVVDEMVSTGVAQSVHAYWPAQISHYRASWVDRRASFPEPSWPIRDKDGSVRSGRGELEKRFAPWAAVARKGIGVHCGECGCYNKTPHKVFMAWFRDVMEVLHTHGIGYSLWSSAAPSAS